MTEKITIDRALLEQALEAIELHLTHHENGCVFLSDIPDAFRAALEQPPRQPLTDEQIHDCFQNKHRDKIVERRLIARAIERAHGIKGEQE